MDTVTVKGDGTFCVTDKVELALVDDDMQVGVVQSIIN